MFRNLGSSIKDRIAFSAVQSSQDIQDRTRFGEGLSRVCRIRCSSIGRRACEELSSLDVFLNSLASKCELGHARVSQEVSRGRKCIGLGAEAGLVERETYLAVAVHSPVSCMMIPAPRLGGATAKTSEDGLSCT